MCKVYNICINSGLVHLLKFVTPVCRTNAIFPDPPGLRGFAPYWIFLAGGLPLYILSAVYLVTGNSIVGLAVS